MNYKYVMLNIEESGHCEFRVSDITETEKGFTTPRELGARRFKKSALNTITGHLFMRDSISAVYRRCVCREGDVEQVKLRMAESAKVSVSAMREKATAMDEALAKWIAQNQ